MRQLTPAESRGFLDYIQHNHVDDLVTHATGVDGRMDEYVHITRAGGRRVTAQNPAFNSPHERLINYFQDLAARGDCQTHYLKLEKMDARTSLLFSDRVRHINGIGKREMS